MYWRLISHLLQFLNALTCSSITVLFKCSKLHHILSLFFTINLPYVLETNISFVRIFKCSNLQPHYSFFQVHQIASCVLEINISINIQVYCREQGQNLMQQKWDSFGTTFYKNILLRIFFKIQCQKSPLAPRHIFNKVDRGIVRSSRPEVFSEKGVLKIRSKFAKATLLKLHFGIGVLL